MEDFDFDKRFAEKMRQTGAPDFSEEDWERLLPKLDAAYRRRWIVLPIWWLGILSGLLLCSNIAWWQMWHQSEQRMEAFRKKWQQTQHIADTVTVKTIVYQYDTVYKTLIYKNLSGNGSFVAGSGASPGIFPNINKAGIETAGIHPGSGQLIAANQSTTQQINPLDSTAFTFEKFKNEEPLERLPLKTAPLQIPVRVAHPLETAVASIHHKQPKKPILQKPKNFRIGAGGGFIMPGAEHLTNTGGFSTNITGEIAFSEQLALTIEGAFCGVYFKGTEYDEGLGLPPLKPPGVDYTLKYFELEEGIKTVVQITTGMRYWWHLSRRIQPYLGLGYTMQWHPGFEIQGEYLNQITGKEKEFSVDVPSLTRPVSLVNLNAGLRYRFLPRLYWQTGAEYQAKLLDNQPGIPRFWGIKSAVLYEF